MYRRPPEKTAHPPTFAKAWWQAKPNLPEAFVLAPSIYAIGTLLALLTQGMLLRMGSDVHISALNPLVGGAVYALSVWIRSLGSGYRSGTRTQLVITHAALCTLILALSFS